MRLPHVAFNDPTSEDVRAYAVTGMAFNGLVLVLYVLSLALGWSSASGIAGRTALTGVGVLISAFAAVLYRRSERARYARLSRPTPQG